MTDNIAAYVAHIRLRGFSEETIAGRIRFLRRIAAALPCLIDEATPAELTAWRAALPVSDRTVVRYVSHARCYYDWAIDAGLRDDNPARRVPVPRTGRLLPRPVGDEDLAAALAGAPPVIRAWLVLAAWCGLRAKELALLRRENILDTARAAVLLVAADATKGHSERLVPLCTFVLAELAALGLPASGWVFRRADGQPGPNTPGRVSQLCGTYLRSRGIIASLHQFRHWFGTGTYCASLDLRLVQELMGHQNPASTAGYAAYHQAHAAAAVEALPVPGRLAAA